MFATKSHKNALPCTVAHGLTRVNQREREKINGIKHLDAVSHGVSEGKNRFKNKDLRAALKVLGEIPRRWGMCNCVGTACCPLTRNRLALGQNQWSKFCLYTDFRLNFVYVWTTFQAKESPWFKPALPREKSLRSIRPPPLVPPCAPSSTSPAPGI